MAHPRHTATDEAPARLTFANVGRWDALLHVATGALVGAVAFPTIVALLSTGVALIPTIVGALIVATLTIVVNDVLAMLHRSRFRALLGLHIPAPRRPAGPWWPWLTRSLTSATFWRSLAYNGFAGMLSLVAGVALAAWFGAAVAAATTFFHPSQTSWPFSGEGSGSLGTTLLGLVGIFVVPMMARAVAYGDAALAALLLGPGREEAFDRRVGQLARSRTEVVAAADAERRRIERDLHDGAQQRLTALAMNLGIAKATVPDLSEPARKALDDAHSEAKLALTEIRGIVRGLHPAVLDDRGLDAALSGLAGRSPVPVTLDVHLHPRPPREVEAVAYFVVSEALTNAAKHAAASRVDVGAWTDGPWLRLRVVDDGIGGADPSRGTGLTGLRQRVASLDGRLTVESPLGGPTVLEVTLPCAS
ncbi:MAG: sensor histidine kinase [Dermatophilaceae bacterium]